MAEKYGYIVPLCDPAEAITPPAGHLNIFVNLSGSLCSKDSSGTVVPFKPGAQVYEEGEYYYTIPTANIGDPIETNGNIRKGYDGATKTWFKEERIAGVWESIATGLED